MPSAPDGAGLTHPGPRRRDAAGRTCFRSQSTRTDRGMPVRPAKMHLALELTDEFEIAVVAALRVAARTLVRCGPTLQSALGPIRTAACRLGHRSLRPKGIGRR